MPTPTVVLNIVGPDAGLLQACPTPARHCRTRLSRIIAPTFPPLTRGVDGDRTTTIEHGIVGNGWYDRESRSPLLEAIGPAVRGEKVWETARHRDPKCTCCTMFWWYNVRFVGLGRHLRPMYLADGRNCPTPTNPAAPRATPR